MEPQIGDLIRCDPARYKGTHPDYTQWHVITWIDTGNFYVKFLNAPHYEREWTRTYGNFEFSPALKQSII